MLMKEKKMNETKIGKYLYILGVLLFLISLVYMNFDIDFEIRSPSYIVIPRDLYMLSIVSISMFFVGVVMNINMQFRREISFILIILGAYLFWIGGIENHMGILVDVSYGYKYLTTTTIYNYIMQIIGPCLFFIGLIHTLSNKIINRNL